jgi:hypothetical protein
VADVDELVKRCHAKARTPVDRAVATREADVLIESEAESLEDRLLDAIRATSPGTTVTMPVAPVPPPAEPVGVGEVEELLGHELPVLLGRLLTEVGNGGFGPGYGLIGARGGATDDRGDDLSALVRQPWVPEAMLPVCTHGCGIYDLVTCDGSDQMWRFDPNRDPDGQLVALGTSLGEWVLEWLDGDPAS